MGFDIYYIMSCYTRDDIFILGERACEFGV